MSLIFHWTEKNYRNDESAGHRCSYCLNQKDKKIHDVAKGERIWAFTRRTDGRYVLALDLVVADKQFNVSGDYSLRYGKYRVLGDKKESRYFDVENGPDATPLLRSLFPISGVAKRNDFALGQSFQGRGSIKILSAEAERQLMSFSKKCPLDI